MPEHHEATDVLLTVEFTFGKVTGALAPLDLFMDPQGSRLQYRASGLGHVDLCCSVMDRHGG